jgi:amino acid adenylation domain-containing protein
MPELTVDPGVRLSQLPLLSESEGDQLRLRRVAPRPSCPLSLPQRDLWVQAQLHPDSCVSCAQVFLCGPLDQAAFVQALQALVDGHEALRTSFPGEGSEPVQRISEGLALRCELEDLSALGAEARAARCEALVEELECRRFDLAAAPLFHTRLLRLAATEHLFLFAFHHLLLDSPGVALLVEALARAYAACVGDDHEPLPPPVFQYRDFTLWQRARINAGALAPHLATWRRQLRSPLPAMALPADRQPPRRRGLASETVDCPLDPDLVRGVRTLARSCRSTLFQTVVAGVEILAWRLTGETDLLIGVPMSMRPPRMREALGVFANAWPLRARVDPRQRFREALAQVQQAMTEGRKARELPIGEALEGFEPRDGRRFLFPLCVSRTRDIDVAAGGLRMRYRDAVSPWGNDEVDLDFVVTSRSTDDGRVRIRYAAELFERETMERIGGYLQRILEQVARDPEKRVGELEILPPEERERVLSDWNATARPYPRERCLAEVFEEQASRAPEAEAVVFGEQRISYGELDRRAGRLAAWLRQHGVGADVLVPLLLERSVEMVVALLAVVKAGGGYVPLETDLPPLRLQALLRQLGASPVLLTQESLHDALERAGGFAGEVSCVERWSDLPEGTAVPERVRPESVGYVNFTSGSTGEPKGVLVPQRAVVRLVKNADHLRLERSDVVTQISTYAWDAAIFEIWGALLNGARLVLVSREQALDFAELGRLLRQERVSVVFLTTALFNRVVDEALEILSTVRAVLVGGERASDLHFARAKKALPRLRLINAYGPTENGAFSSWQEMEAGAEKVSIGRPVSNSRVYVLDDGMEPVPIGVLGEIYLGGDGLARGYLGRAELTAERFVPDPFSDGGRLYRSGDRGRWLGGGELSFAGRLDDQVKVRGHRIEPAEVESALRSHPAVRDAVVVTREASGGEKELVAYVVGERELRVHDLRAHLTARLPSYMVPSFFVGLDELPLTAAGKVDRRRLPEPEGTRPGLGVGYEAPRTELEERIAQVWREVLGLDRVGVHDNFFDLGGYSLKTTQVRARLQRAFEVDLPLGEILERPTIAEQAAAVAERQGPGLPRAEALVPSAGAREAYPLSRAQRGLYFLQRLEPENTYYNVVNRIVIEGPFDRSAFAEAFRVLVARHATLRTSFDLAGAEPVQRLAAHPPLDLPFYDLGGLGEDERGRQLRELVMTRAAQPFDLEAPPVRAALARLAPRRHLFTLVAHHIVMDGLSRHVLVRDLLRLYAAQGRGLPELPVRYVDYAVWQNDRIEKGLLKEQEEYWLGRLAGELPALELPGEHRRVRPGGSGFTTSFEALEGDRRVADAVRRLAESCEATPFMVQLALFKTLLAKLSGEDDVLVGTSVGGRDRAELEDLVGTFANTVVLRTDLGGDPTLEEVVRRVREGCVEAFARQEVPFDVLVERLRPSRDVHDVPIAKVFFWSGPALRPETAGETSMAVHEISGSAESWRGSGNFALGLYCLEKHDGSLTWNFIYDADRFDRDAVRGIKSRMASLLESVVAHA